MALAVILLKGGVTGADHHRQRPAALAHRLPGSTEVQQDRAHPARFQLSQIDVLRLDVAVQEALGVDCTQAVQDRQHELLGLFLRQAPALMVQVLGERQPLIELHHQIGGVIGLEDLIDAHDVGVVELGQGARLGQELSQPEAQQLAILAAVRGHGGPVGRPPGEIPRQIFLERDAPVQPLIPGEIGDTEPARFAEHPAHQVLTMQQGAQRQEQRRAPGLLVIAAVRARIGAALAGKAAGAEVSGIGCSHRLIVLICGGAWRACEWCSGLMETSPAR